MKPLLWPVALNVCTVEGLGSWFAAVYPCLSQVLKNVASLLSAELRFATLFMAIIWFCMAFRLVHNVMYHTRTIQLQQQVEQKGKSLGVCGPHRTQLLDTNSCNVNRYVPLRPQENWQRTSNDMTWSAWGSNEWMSGVIPLQPIRAHRHFKKA